MDKQRGSIIIAILALLVSLGAIVMQCQNYYRVSTWMASHEQRRLESERQLTEAIISLRDIIKKR